MAEYEYIDKHEAYKILKDLEAAYIQVAVKEAYGTAALRIDQLRPKDVQPVNRWISVINELPKTTKSCLVWYEYDSLWGRFRDYGISWYTGESWYEGFLEGDNIKVLHWQPLPEPPETTKG